MLNDQEFDKEIRIKLLEETQEVVVAATRTELIGEIADLYEVFDALAELYAITQVEIVVEKLRKYNEHGNF